jgi:hypothetical protein
LFRPPLGRGRWQRYCSVDCRVRRKRFVEVECRRWDRELVVETGTP